MILRPSTNTWAEEKPGELAEKILNVLERQTFADWYNSGGFDQYITGEIPKEEMSYEKQKEKVLRELKAIFGIYF